ncbi:hypothetical protein CGZ93_00115 [Enemella dayhoffiae]|uniref:Uncharacterized protein n=1 Tax=Enemella dayhoffiae TaxID=2016507 RepID=A0A255HBL5_9ACTN|nr:carbohydrate ABC transporter permease [Enemella dayhoffiae]OYO24927.1 hypothetical protein CGZ93_00115 [Enemella dayhoffiae]
MIIPTIRGVMVFVSLIMIMDKLRVMDNLIPLSTQATSIGNKSIMLYVFHTAFTDGSPQLGLGSAINVLTIILILIALWPSVRGILRRLVMADLTADHLVHPVRPRRRLGTSQVLIGVFLAATCVIMLAPFLWTTLSVIKPTNVAFANPPVWSFTPSAQAFVDLWQTSDFYKYLLNTIVVAVISTIVALIIGLPAAYALSRFPSYVGDHSRAGADLPGTAAILRWCCRCVS